MKTITLNHGKVCARPSRNKDDWGSLCRWGGGMINYYDRLIGQGGIWYFAYYRLYPEDPKSGNLARNWAGHGHQNGIPPSGLGHASLSISDPEKCSASSAKVRKTRKLGHRETGFRFISSKLQSVPTPGRSRSWDTRNATSCTPQSASSPRKNWPTKRHAL